MNKVVSRLLVFFIGIPLILCLVFFKAYNHIVLHITICIISALASLELYNLFSKKVKLLSKGLLIFCSTIIPLAAAISCVLPYFLQKNIFSNHEIVTYVLIFSFLIILLCEVFTAKTFENSITRISASFFIVVYSGYLMSFISKMSLFSYTVIDTNSATVIKDVSIPFISVFLLMVFICDSLAWFFGVLFGKNNRGLVKASPNKSLAGFIGGFGGSIIAGITGYFIWPDIFYGSIIKIIIIGFIIALSAIIGDLIESIIKRSAECKDSGSIIPGRGGVLDSVDSILMSAPVYYLLISIFYHPIS